jgi:hypothetical protein
MQLEFTLEWLRPVLSGLRFSTVTIHFDTEQVNRLIHKYDADDDELSAEHNSGARPFCGGNGKVMFVLQERHGYKKRNGELSGGIL